MTTCYAMVRGSAIRVTDLDARGRLDSSEVRYAVSKSVANVRINEVSEAASNEMLRDDEGERRVLLRSPAQTIRFTCDIEFLRVDPELLSLIAAGVAPVRSGLGFGAIPFGAGPFGDGIGDIVGFDSRTKVPAKAFALEVWTRLSPQACANAGPGLGFGEGDFGDSPFGSEGVRRWGYTLFPFLRGGLLSGFKFANGLVSFNLTGAQTRRNPGWGVGPYDLNGEFQRLVGVVSGNASWRQTLVDLAPPTETCGVQTFADIIDGGTASMTSEDILDGEFVVTSPWIIDGGGA